MLIENISSDFVIHKILLYHIKHIKNLIKIFFIIFFIYIKMTTNYHEKHKEKLWKEPCERYKNLSEEKKDTRWKKARERYQNPSEEEKSKKHQDHCEPNENLWGTKAKESWL